MTLSIDSLGGSYSSYANLITAARANPRSTEVQKEFLTIFYKELLKQTFKAPDLSIHDDKEEENNLLSSFSSDAMIDQLAQEMASRAALGTGSLPVAAGGR
jgi:Rod binding domain-containing protein